MKEVKLYKDENGRLAKEATKVTAYETSEGNFVENKKEAEWIENHLSFVEKIKDLIECYGYEMDGVYGEKYMVTEIRMKMSDDKWNDYINRN